MEAFAFLHSGIQSLPPLAKFALGMTIIVCIPPFSRRVRLPEVVGLLLSGVVVALVAGKWIAAEIAGRVFTYTAAARLTMWSLTLPQVAATLAAALVAFHTVDPLDQRLIDSRMLNVVLVLMLTTATLGPLLTQHFAPRMLEDLSVPEALSGRNGEEVSRRGPDR